VLRVLPELKEHKERLVQLVCLKEPPVVKEPKEHRVLKVHKVRFKEH